MYGIHSHFLRMSKNLSEENYESFFKSFFDDLWSTINLCRKILDLKDF